MQQGQSYLHQQLPGHLFHQQHNARGVAEESHEELDSLWSSCHLQTAQNGTAQLVQLLVTTCTARPFSCLLEQDAVAPSGAVCRLSWYEHIAAADMLLPLVLLLPLLLGLTVTGMSS